MKPNGEQREFLLLERSRPEDEAVARVGKRVLNHHITDPKEARSWLFARMRDWLEDGNDSPVFALSADEVEVCIKMIKSQVEIAEESPRHGDPKGTATPHAVSIAKGALPGMEQFVAERRRYLIMQGLVPLMQNMQNGQAPAGE